MKTKSAKKRGQVLFEPVHKSVEIGNSSNLLEVALSNNIELNHTCGGMGSCTTCRIFVLKGKMSPRTEIEKERAEERGFSSNERLACQLKPVDQMVVEIPAQRNQGS